MLGPVSVPFLRMSLIDGLRLLPGPQAVSSRPSEAFSLSLFFFWFVHFQFFFGWIFFLAEKEHKERDLKCVRAGAK